MDVPSSMRAVRFHEYGDESVLRVETVPVPSISDDESLVLVEACGINHVDMDLRGGISRFPLALPHILGREIVGVVTRIGGKVRDVRVGDRVLVATYIGCGKCDFCRAGLATLCDRRELPGVNLPGGYAEYVKVPASALLAIPENLTSIEVAALPVAFGTAWHGLIGLGNLRAGETVLITGAAGGVGTAAVQVARFAGATTIAASGSDRKLEQVRDLGAELTVNYNTEELDKAVLRMTDGKGVDLVLESVGGETFGRCLGCLAKNGRLVVSGAHAGEKQPLDLVTLFRLQHRVIGVDGANPEDLRMILKLAARGHLKAVVNSVVPLAGIRDAHRMISSRDHVGKVIVNPLLC